MQNGPHFGMQHGQLNLWIWVGIGDTPLQACMPVQLKHERDKALAAD